jgi:iron complex outermembrane receptor protein
VSPVFSIESGVRADHADDYGWFFLPRAYGLFQFGPQWTSRLGGGMGYKVPSVFNETSEETGYQGLRPLSGREKAERSIGANWDVNYKGIIGDLVGVNVNQLFFYTRIEDPLTFDPDSVSVGVYRMVNRRGHFRSRGAESNLRLSYKDVKFLMGYTFIDAILLEGGSSTRIPLVARHRLGLVLIYEVEHVGRIGLETYYTGRQRRSDQSDTRSYWVTGIMAERQWRKFSLFLNLENLFDTRQSRYERLFDGTRQQPDFREIYAPVDGFVANGGVKMRF